jgi:uncharacterized protein (DUF486 family)
MDAILNFMGNGGIIIAIILLVITVALWIVFALKSLLSNFEQSKKSLLGIVALAVIAIIGYALASGGPNIPQFAIDGGISASQYKLVGAIINLSLFATIATIILTVGSFIKGFLSRN